jgi:hypothetical protein
METRQNDVDEGVMVNHRNGGQTSQAKKRTSCFLGSQAIKARYSALISTHRANACRFAFWCWCPRRSLKTLYAALSSPLKSLKIFKNVFNSFMVRK